MSEMTVELANRHSHPKRLVLGGIGLGVLIWPIWDLWPGIASFSPVSPVFWIIGLGAAAIGGILLSAAVFGRSTVLTVLPTGLDLVEETLLGQRRRGLRPDEVGPVSVVEHEWSEGPATWRVTVALQGSKPLTSEDFRDRAEAERLAARLAEALARQAR
jgi:hypothetical protein